MGEVINVALFAIIAAQSSRWWPRDWHLHDRARRLVRPYQLTLDAILLSARWQSTSGWFCTRCRSLCLCHQSGVDMVNRGVRYAVEGGMVDRD